VRILVLVLLLAACKRPTPDELVRAVRAGDVKAVARLLDDGVDPNAAEDSEPGDTVLCIAATRSDLPVMELLLRHKADPRRAGPRRLGRIPIECSRSAASVRALVAAGADVEGDRGKQRPLALASDTCDLEYMDALLASGAEVDGVTGDGEGYPGLGVAAARGHMACVQRLLAAGAVVDRRDYLGNTALMSAVIYGHTDVVRLLLERGADPLAANRAGHTPAYRSTDERRKEVHDILIAAGVTEFGMRAPPALPPGELIHVPVR